MPNALGRHPSSAVGADFGNGQKVSAFVASDSARAKQAATELAQSAGFDVVDAGGLKNARHLEPLAGLAGKRTAPSPSVRFPRREPHDGPPEPPAARSANRTAAALPGVGSNAEDLQPLGAYLSAMRRQAAVVSVRSPDRSEFGAGWQWFSVSGIREENRPERVEAALPVFVRTVRDLQQACGVAAAQTTLIGFSQGGIMALESTQLAEPPAGRVIAIGARFARPPRVAPAATRVHLMHGESDGVMPKALSVAAAERLQALGAAVTCDLFPGLGHGIDGRVARRIVERFEGA